jgi:hypothetical protein
MLSQTTVSSRKLREAGKKRDWLECKKGRMNRSAPIGAAAVGVEDIEDAQVEYNESCVGVTANMC